MTGVEIILILAGLVMMIGSFMVTEKLSGAELDRIAELSQNEIKKILENKLKDAEAALASTSSVPYSSAAVSKPD